MAKPYTVSIVNGQGTANVLNDTYNVTANCVGYDNNSIDPNSVTVVEGTNSYEFLISANGSLTFHVTETGLVDGTPVIGAKFMRCDASGTTYGTEVTTDQSGNAVLLNLPFDSTDAPNVYYKQIASDGNHEFDSSVKTINLTTLSTTLEIANTIAIERTFTLKDKNYNGLAIDSGTINLG